MGRRLMISCFSVLIVLMVFVPQAGSDFQPALWGELIQNNRYVNIHVGDGGLRIHQRVEMKLKKFLSDDYTYTFITSSTYGQFDESALKITAPSCGVEDSIFDYGCRLDYLSETTLEETLQVVFEYEYQYPYQEIKEIVYESREGSRGFATIINNNEQIDIRCNRIMEVKTKPYYSSTWTSIRGIHVVVRPHYYGMLKICLSTEGAVEWLEDTTFFEAVPVRLRDIPNLIKNEFITIEMSDTLDGLYHYRLSGTIELDLKTATLFDPFYAWFPNDETRAFVAMMGKVAYPGENSSQWRDWTKTLEVKPATYEGQRGFYILIPQLTPSSSGWPEPYGWKQATLHVKIDDIHVGNRSDFFLVTAPQEFSSVEFRIPERFGFGHCYSPFEHEATYNDNGFHVKTFYGKCLSTGVAHVSWGTVPFPEDYFVLFQNSPNPFNQETIIRYSLCGDCDVKLCVYNLLGQRVRTLVDQVQRADDYQVSWDGKNEQGQDVASGVYLYKLETQWRSDRKKMVVIR
ncbi:MAG: FlgD immunoglobulin-like domain containing protein [Candidatus Zixiibacteriota bacterium]